MRPFNLTQKGFANQYTRYLETPVFILVLQLLKNGHTRYSSLWAAWKVPAQKSSAHCDGYLQPREFTAGCSARPINQYMIIQTKGLFSFSSQKQFLIPQGNQKPETLGWLE